MLAESYLHNLDPFLIEFPRGWPLAGLRWYGISYLAGFFIAWMLIRWLTTTGRSLIHRTAVGDFLFAIIAGVIVGGRLGYVLFYDPALLIEFSSDAPWWGLLAINQGGMASHGGMLGVMGGMWWFAHKQKIPLRHLFDVGSFAAPTGLGLGRLANFINGELPGKALANQSDPPGWSVKFPQSFHDWITTWIDPSTTDAAHQQVALKLASMTDAVESVGVPARDWMAMVAAGPTRDGVEMARDVVDRIINAVRDGDQVVEAAVRPLLTACYPSQLVQALTDGPLLMLIVVLVWLKPRKPGVVGCWFFMGYGLMRILSEVVREPDVGVALLFGLSRGQVLSIGMILIGAACLWFFSRMDEEPIGGLLRPRTTDA